MLFWLIWLGSGAPSVQPADDWVIVPRQRAGLITTASCEDDLRRSYGAAQVRRAPIDVGEGQREDGTILFDQIPTQRISILWKDPVKRCLPRRLMLTGTTSRWKVEGIGLGTTLKELERINQQPLVLLGFGWDYGGTVRSWSTGKLARSLGSCDPECPRLRVLVRLSAPVDPRGRGEAHEATRGDKEFSSSHPAMQRLNPTVYQLVAEL